MSEEHLDGCELDFTESPSSNEDISLLLVPAGEEEDEEDA